MLGYCFTMTIRSDEKSMMELVEVSRDITGSSLSVELLGGYHTSLLLLSVQNYNTWCCSSRSNCQVALASLGNSAAAISSSSNYILTPPFSNTLRKSDDETAASAKFSVRRRPGGPGVVKPQAIHRIKQMQIYMRSQDCSEDRVPMIWLATEGGSRHRVRH